MDCMALLEPNRDRTGVDWIWAQIRSSPVQVDHWLHIESFFDALCSCRLILVLRRRSIHSNFLGIYMTPLITQPYGKVFFAKNIHLLKACQLNADYWANITSRPFISTDHNYSMQRAALISRKALKQRRFAVPIPDTRIFAGPIDRSTPRLGIPQPGDKLFGMWSWGLPGVRFVRDKVRRGLI